MTDERLKKTYALFADCWKLFREFCVADGNQEKAGNDRRWEKCAERARELAERHGKEAADMILDTMEMIEHSEREAMRGISQYRLDPPIRGKENGR